MQEWFREHVWMVAAVSAFMFLATAAAGLYILIKLPSDQFTRKARDPGAGKQPLTLAVARNILGVTLLAIGILLSLPLVPGPGLLILVLGLSLIDFPGRRKVILWILKHARLLQSINKLRAKAGRPPLEIPGD